MIADETNRKYIGEIGEAIAAKFLKGKKNPHPNVLQKLSKNNEESSAYGGPIHLLKIV